MACACLFPIAIIACLARTFAISHDLPVNQKAGISNERTLHRNEFHFGIVKDVINLPLALDATAHIDGDVDVFDISAAVKGKKFFPIVFT